MCDFYTLKFIIIIAPKKIGKKILCFQTIKRKIPFCLEITN